MSFVTVGALISVGGGVYSAIDGHIRRKKAQKELLLGINANENIKLLKEYNAEIEKLEAEVFKLETADLSAIAEPFIKEADEQNLQTFLDNFTKITGIRSLAQMGAKAMGKKDCGCKKRQEVLNKAFPYKK